MLKKSIKIFLYNLSLISLKKQICIVPIKTHHIQFQDLRWYLVYLVRGCTQVKAFSPLKRKCVHMVKMMSRLRFALDLSAFSTARSIKRPFPLASIEGVGRQKEEEAIGGGEHQSASLVIVWAMSNAPVYTPSLPTDIMRNEGGGGVFLSLLLSPDAPFARL